MEPAPIDGPFADYTFHAFDVSLASVAWLYGTTLDAIFEANRSAEAYADAATTDEFVRRVFDGTQLLLPVPSKEQDLWWERRPVRQRYPNLSAVCREANSDRVRHGMPTLTPTVLLRYAVNAELRGRLGVSFSAMLGLEDGAAPDARAPQDPVIAAILASPGALARRSQADIEADIGAIPLPDDAVVAIPYPPSRVQAIIAAAARPKDAPYDLVEASTATTVPAWVRELCEEHLFPLWFGAQELSTACFRCQQIRDEAVRELGVLSVLQWFIDSQAGDPDHVRSLQQALSDLHDVALNRLGHDPAAIVGCPEDLERRRLVEDTSRRLRDARLGELVQQGLKSADPDIIHYDYGDALSFAIKRTPLKSLIVRVLASAVLSLALAGGDEPFCRDVDDAIDGMGSAKKAAPKGATALQVVLSVAGAASDVERSLVGGARADVRSLALIAISVSAVSVLPSLVAGSVSPRVEVSERLANAVGIAASFTPREAETVKAALKHGSPGDISKVSSALSGASSAGKLLSANGTVMFISSVAIIIRIAKGDDEPVRLVADLLKTSATKASSILKYVGELAPSKAPMVLSAQRGLKAFGSWMGVVSGVITFFDGLRSGDAKVMIVGSLQIASAVAGFLTLAFESCAAIPVVGEALALAAAILSLIGINLDLMDLDIEATQRVFQQLLGTLSQPGATAKETPWFRRVMDHDEELRKAYERVVHLASEGNPFPYGIRRSHENFDVLRKLLPPSVTSVYIDEKILESREHAELRRQPWNQGGLSP